MSTSLEAVRPLAAVSHGRVPPQNLDAERSVLGGVLLDNAALNDVLEVLKPDDFYREAHRKVFEAMCALSSRGEPIDRVTLKNELAALGAYEQVGGEDFIDLLDKIVPSASNLTYYARIVHEKALARRVIEAAHAIATQGYEQHGDVGEFLDDAERRIFAITEVKAQTAFTHVREIVKTTFKTIETLYERQEEITGIPTGFADLDRLTSGFQPGDLVILAARPSMGKAQPLDAKVLLEDGSWTTMGDLRCGDRLASVDGARSRVAALFPQGERQLYRVTFSDGRSTECCAEHLWRVHYRGWPQPRILSTTEIAEKLTRVRYRHRLWIDQVTGEFGQDDDLPVDPWLLGALLGDGCLTHSSPMFSTADEAMLEKAVARAGSQFVARAAGGYDWRIVRPVRGSSRSQLISGLRALGVWGVAGDAKFIPDCYLRASRAARLELLRGLLDTDGWVEKWGSIRFGSTSERLARGMVDLVRSLGGWCSIRQRRTTSCSYRGARRIGSPSWVCNIHHSHPETFLSLERKRDRAARLSGRRWQPVIVSVQPTRRAPAQCIAVTHPSRLYVTDDYVVTHNTAFCLNIATHVGCRAKFASKRIGVGVFSLEMPKEQLVMRMLASEARVDSQRIRTGRLIESDWAKLAHAAGSLAEANIHIDDSPGLSSLELRAKARRLAGRFSGSDSPLGLVVVDYLQLMKGNERIDSREQQISEISRSLKALAKELGVPVLALSQLNRSLEKRPDKRPLLSDLRESGSLEQDADTVVFLYREEVYEKEKDDVKGVAEIIVGKQRNGPIGTATAAFLHEFTRFENLARDYAGTGGQ